MGDDRAVQLVGPDDGETVHRAQGHDRFVIPGELTGGGFALLEHVLVPKALGGPIHRHTREDEYSYVLEGQLGAILGDEEVVVDAGSLIFKPRRQWHTFWNAGDGPVRVLEIISPGGFERVFRELAALGDAAPDAVVDLASRYGVEIDFEATMPLMQRHGVTF